MKTVFEAVEAGSSVWAGGHGRGIVGVPRGQLGQKQIGWSREVVMGRSAPESPQEGAARDEEADRTPGAPGVVQERWLVCLRSGLGQGGRKEMAY